MNMKPNMKRAERRVFRAYWSDGLLDMFVGLSVLTIGLGWWVDLFTPSLAAPVVACFFWRAAHERLVEPRMGSVVFSTRRRHDMLQGLIAIASLGLVVGGNLVTRIWMGKGHSGFAEWFAPAIPATIVAAMALSTAAAFGLWRFVGYGLLFSAVGLTVAAAKSEPWFALIAGGAGVIICGLLMLRTFFHRHPLPSARREVGAGS